MGLGQRFKKKSENFEVFATAGTIGLHMVSGPAVGFAMGYGLDLLFDTNPWMKLIFLGIGIIAGFLNVYRDTQLLLRKMQQAKENSPRYGGPNREKDSLKEDKGKNNGIGNDD